MSSRYKKRNKKFDGIRSCDNDNIIDYFIKVDNKGRFSTISPMLPSVLNRDYLNAAEKILKYGTYEIPPYGTFLFGNTIDWSGGATETRSFKRMLHGQFYVIDLIEAYKKTLNKEYLCKAYEIVKSWINNNPFVKPSNSMAWHDETTARRLLVWIAFFEAARKFLPYKDIKFLFENMKNHVSLLSSSSFYSKNTNHGMIQDLALIIYSDYFSELGISHQLNELACSRLRQYFSFIFSEEGVHLEHSPSYHVMIAEYLRKFGKYLILMNNPLGSHMLNLYKKSAKYATYVIKPDGYLPQLGDTTKTKPNRSLWEDNVHYLYSSTGGSKGECPTQPDMVFPLSGYAIFRDNWSNKENATYVLFSAAYHTNYHKHSDDLSLWIYSKGDIIIESGPYSYDYNDKFSQYAYSSFAHNALIVDNHGLPRIDGKYGLTKIVNYDINSEISRVTGINDRFEGVSHSRTLEYAKSQKNIRVTDCIKTGESHEYKLLWHLAPDIEPLFHDGSITLYRSNTPVMDICMSIPVDSHISYIKGQTEPLILGWYCEKFNQKIPTGVLEVDFKGQDISLTTDFTLL